MLKYKINDIKQLTVNFVENIFNSLNIIGMKSYYDELEYIWQKLIEFKLNNYFSDYQKFFNFIEILTNQEFDNLVTMIHTEDNETLSIFLQQKFNPDLANVTIKPFYILIVEFFKAIQKENLMSVSVMGYIFVGGRSLKNIRTQKKQLMKIEGAKLLTKFWHKFRPIYLIYIPKKMKK